MAAGVERGAGEETERKVSVNNRRATFSIKAITGIDCFHVSLVTVQLAGFTRIKTDECRTTQACDVRRIINGTFKAPAFLYSCHWGSQLS